MNPNTLLKNLEHALILIKTRGNEKGRLAMKHQSSMPPLPCTLNRDHNRPIVDVKAKKPNIELYIMMVGGCSVGFTKFPGGHESITDCGKVAIPARISEDTSPFACVTDAIRLTSRILSLEGLRVSMKGLGWAVYWRKEDQLQGKTAGRD